MTGDLLPWFGLVGGLVAVGQLVWLVVKEYRGGAIRKSSAEAAKAALDTAQAEQALPHVQESLKLGNVETAVSIQQNIINGLQEHITWQDGQITERDNRIVNLETARDEYERRVADLEKRLRVAEAALAGAREALDGLRKAAAAAHDQEDHTR